MNAAVAEIEAPETAPGAPAPASGRHRPYEIVIVEDSKTDARLMLLALQSENKALHVTLLTDGEKAAAHLHDLGTAGDLPFGRPDLVFLDLNLPRKDGFEVLGDIKAEALLRGVPVVVFTSSERPAEVSRCYEMGANCVTTKPLELEPFMATVGAIGHYWLDVVGNWGPHGWGYLPSFNPNVEP